MLSCSAYAERQLTKLSAISRPRESRQITLLRSWCSSYRLTVTPPPSVTIQRFTFNTRLQKDGETVSQFVAELRRLSQHCAFDVSLDDMLRDWLVCSVRNTRVQRRLLAKLNLTFKKAFEICQSAEVAEKNARELQMSQKYKVPPLLGYH